MKNWIFKKSKQTWNGVNFFWKSILFILICNIFIFILTSSILEKISSRDFITILPALKITVSLLLGLVIIVLSFRKRLKVENHQGLLNFILIVFTIALTFSAYFIDRQNSFSNTNTALVRVNEINIEIAEAIIKKDYGRGYPFIFFLTWPYEQNISFISKNFISNNCVTNYYKVMMEMRVVNDILSSITMHAVEESSVRKIVANKASSTMDLIMVISKNCHPIGTSNLN